MVHDDKCTSRFLFDDRAYAHIVDKSNDLRIQRHRCNGRPVVKCPYSRTSETVHAQHSSGPEHILYVDLTTFSPTIISNIPWFSKETLNFIPLARVCLNKTRYCFWNHIWRNYSKILILILFSLCQVCVSCLLGLHSRFPSSRSFPWELHESASAYWLITVSFEYHVCYPPISSNWACCLNDFLFREPKLPPPPPLQSPLYEIFWGLHQAVLHVRPGTYAIWYKQVYWTL